MTNDNDSGTSKLIVNFVAPGSAHFSLGFEGIVSAEQVCALAGQLKLMFEHELLSAHVAQQVKAAKEKIAVPENKGIIRPN